MLVSYGQTYKQTYIRSIMDDEHRTQLEEINVHLSELVGVLSRLLKLSEMKL